MFDPEGPLFGGMVYGLIVLAYLLIDYLVLRWRDKHGGYSLQGMVPPPKAKRNQQHGRHLR